MDIGFHVLSLPCNFWLRGCKLLGCKSLLFLTMNLTGYYCAGKLSMDHNETGCEAPPDVPLLCINNCGFFGSAATMNMCSKCHKDMLLKQEHAKLAASSIESIMEGSSSSNAKEPIGTSATVAIEDMQPGPTELMLVSTQVALASPSETNDRVKEGPKRCSSCRKRVGLTGFNCRCGNLFCAVHRYSDKHACPFDYRTAARDAIAKSNPVIKPEKLDKI